MIKIIDKITIRNVKGIENFVFDVRFIPNKPTLVVAPNGFGKSSITAAFRSLRSRKMDLDKDEYYRGDEGRHPSLKISYTMQDGSRIEKEANYTKNELTEIFNVHVINSQLVSKTRKFKISGQDNASSEIGVTPIVLIKNIPPKGKFSYSFTKVKRGFGKNGKVLPNISNLLDDNRIMAKIWNQVDFTKQGQVGVKKAIKTLQDEINAGTGNTNKILADVKDATTQAVSAIDFVSGILAAFVESGLNHSSKIEAILAALQIADIHASDKAAFKKAGERADYEFEKQPTMRTSLRLKAPGIIFSQRKQRTDLRLSFQRQIRFPTESEISFAL